MSVGPDFTLRWKNVRGFSDTGTVPIRPLTVIIGPNNSGKSAFLAPLLLLKQTWNSPDPGIALSLHGDLINAGSYQDLVRDHDTDRSISLAIDFLEAYASDDPYGVSAPSLIELEFREGEAPSHFPVLHSFRSLDNQGRILLDRALGRRGYTLPGFTARARRIWQTRLSTSSWEFSNETDQLVRDDRPMNFLFNGNEISRALYSESLDHTSEGESSDFLADFDNPSALTRIYLGLAQFNNHLFGAHLLDNFAYIGPLRQKAARVYEVMQEVPSSVGHAGERTAELMYHHQDDAVRDRIDHWMKHFGFQGQLEVDSVSDSLFSLTLCRDDRAPLNIADCGFGISQVLPLIVSGVTSPKPGVLVAEQPEIHLNPRLQARLADLFVDFANSRSTVLVETHSEHLLLRLRWLVADGAIDPEDISLLYVESGESGSSIREVGLSEDGALHDWPVGFFEDSLNGALGLAAAQSKARARAQVEE